MSAEPNTIPPKPAPMPVIEVNIPNSLKQLARWVVWSWTWNAKRKKWDKPPRNARTGCVESSTDPMTWSTFGEGIRFHDTGRADGIGFTLPVDDPFVAVDLDKCAANGVVEKWAAEIIAALNTYTEISPSGRGIRMLCHGDLPRGRRRKGHVEMYSDGRYVTITGHHVEGTSKTIEHRTVELAALHANVFGSCERPQPPRQFGTGLKNADDQELIRRAKSAMNGTWFRQLWAGDTSGYSSPSEADLALVSMLAFWTGPDAERIDRLFQASALCRDKWAEREDYRLRTIAKALERCEFYTPAVRPAHNVHRRQLPPSMHRRPGNAYKFGLRPARIYVGEGTA